MTDAIGEITILHGEAFADGPEGTRELLVGSPIYNEDTVSTGAKGAVEILFNDGAVLSQGPHSQVQLDDYIFDPDTDAGEMTMNLIEGTFRSVTGEIVDMNPEGFKIDTPHTTIGIRGTTTGHVIGAGGEEEHVVMDFVDRPVVFQPVSGGPVRVISQDGMGLSASPAGLGSVRPAPPNVMGNLEQLSSRALEQGAPIFRDSDGKTEAEKAAEKEQAEAEEAQAEAEAAAEEAAEAEAEAQAAAEVEAEAEAAAQAAAAEAAAAEAAAEAAAQQAAELAAQAAADAAAVEAAAQAAAEAAAAQAAAEAAAETAAQQAAAAEAAAQAAAEAEAAAQAAAAQQAAAEARAVQEAQEAAQAQAEFEAEQAEMSSRDFGADGNEGDSGETGDTDSPDDTDGSGDDDGSGDQEGGGEDLTQDYGQGEDLLGDFADDLAAGADQLGDFTGGAGIADGGSGEEPEEDAPVIDDPVVVNETLLTLADFDKSYNINLAGDPNPFYEEMDQPDTRITISSDIVNVIGSFSQANIITGNDAANQFTGSATSSDIIDGGAGNDTFYATGGEDSYEGGTGVDLISYIGMEYGVKVELGSDSTSYPNPGLDFSDTLSNIENAEGSNKADILWGSSDDNALYGRRGDDLLWGGSGGDDSLFGNGGDDRFKFHDVVSLGGGTIKGGVGTDQIEIWGTGTNDLTGLDSVTGVEGFHFLNNGASVTVETGDFGDFGDNEDPFISVNSVNSTTETLNINITGSNTDIDLSKSTFTNWEAAYDKIEVVGSAGKDTIGGSVYDDTITGNAGDDEILSNGGTDSLDGGADDDKFDMTVDFDTEDIVKGGTGDDSMLVSSFSGDFNNVSGLESIKFTTSMDVTGVSVNLIEAGKTLEIDASEVTGTASFNGSLETEGFNIIGSASSNVLWGGDGNDTFNMALGSGTIRGNGGNDKFYMADDVTSSDILDGGVGDDSLYITDNDSNTDDFTYVKNMEYIKFESGSVSETLVNDYLVSAGKTLIVDGSSTSTMSFNGTTETDGKFNITGSCYADQISGGSGADTLKGGAGADNLFGNSGNDQLFGGTGGDDLHGDAGLDTFYYESTSEGGDLVIGFTAADDSFQFKLSAFNDAGELSLGVNADNFKEINDTNYDSDGSSGLDADDHFVYFDDGSDYKLYYDSNGSAAGGQTLIASFDADADMTSADVEMV